MKGGIAAALFYVLIVLIFSLPRFNAVAFVVYSLEINPKIEEIA